MRRSSTQINSKAQAKKIVSLITLLAISMKIPNEIMISELAVFVFVFS